MIAFRTDTIDAALSYKLISAAVTPRPIAWVSTYNPSGGVNLAPYSSFTFISYSPPKVIISIGPGTDVLKDTLMNISARGEFGVSAVTQAFLDKMVKTSFTYESHESEAEALNIEMKGSTIISTPYVSGAAVSMECKLDRIIDVKDLDAHRLVIGTVVCFHVQPDLWRDGRIDPMEFRPLGRIAGPLYVTEGEILYAPRESAKRS